MTSDDLLGEAVEELYSADPEEFTRRRGELAARARAAGQPAVARQIAGLRKPTRSAWMINQLVRSNPGIATRLAELGEELRAIERSGDGSRMREVSQARRQLIATLVPQALARSGQHPPPAALREEITATFSAALADPEVAEQIRRATLPRPARRAGFGTAQAPTLALVPPLPDARPGGGRDRKPARTRPAPARPAANPPADTTQADSERDRRRAGAKAEQARADSKQDQRAKADTEQDQQAKTEQDQQAKTERDQQAKTERDRRAEAEAEQAARQARAEAEQALADAERAEQAAHRAQQEQEEAVRRLEQQLRDVRRQLHEARAQSRQAEIARRRARQVLGGLPE